MPPFACIHRRQTDIRYIQGQRSSVPDISDEGAGFFVSSPFFYPPAGAGGRGRSCPLTNAWAGSVKNLGSWEDGGEGGGVWKA